MTLLVVDGEYVNGRRIDTWNGIVRHAGQHEEVFSIRVEMHSRYDLRSADDRVGRGLQAERVEVDHRFARSWDRGGNSR